MTVYAQGFGADLPEDEMRKILSDLERFERLMDSVFRVTA